MVSGGALSKYMRSGSVLYGEVMNERVKAALRHGLYTKEAQRLSVG